MFFKLEDKGLESFYLIFGCYAFGIIRLSFGKLGNCLDLSLLPLMHLQYLFVSHRVHVCYLVLFRVDDCVRPSFYEDGNVYKC